MIRLTLHIIKCLKAGFYPGLKYLAYSGRDIYFTKL